MKRLAQIILVTASFVFAPGVSPVDAQSNPPAVVVTGQTAGLTPFISQLQITATGGGGLKSAKFEVVPKPGSVTRPISAVYLADYLESRGYIDATSRQITVPVYGLYADYSNTVKLTCRFVDGSALQQEVTIVTPAFDDPFGYGNPTVIQARTNSKSLSYDFLSLKSNQGTHSPVILDTDGAIRWVGTSGAAYLSTIFYENSFFIPYTPAGGTSSSGIARMELDGTFQFLVDYSGVGVTSTAHHNFDPGKDGFIVEADTLQYTESVLFEVDTAGTILRVWNLGDILKAAMQAGGDDPSQFVYPAPKDWFHNNAAAYRASDDTIIVSSREDFVIALDYESGAIKWILGDTTKKWYQFPSLRQYALALAPGSLPPIGQHSVGITYDDHLLLFDNGKNSVFQTPAGIDRTYSSPRKYKIDTTAKVATEVWNYEQNQSIQVQFTGSVYEDDALNYFIDYASEVIGGLLYTELVALDSAGAKVFDYRYPTPSIGVFAWNAIPIHLENIVYTGPQTALADGHPAFFTGEVPLTNGVSYLEFPGNGNVFGYYSYLAEPHYLYHFGLGYEYWFDATDHQHGIYLYDFASQGIFYTSPSFPFPYLYDFSLGTVLYYFANPVDAEPGAPRYFYNFSTGEIITK